MRKFIVVSAIILTGCASTGPVSIGPDTYMLSKPGDFFTFSGASVKADLYREANEFCTRQNKQVMPVNATSTDSGPARPAEAEIEFRCLAVGDPGLSRPPAPDLTIKVQH